ncbi:MAG: IS1595 family transposase, partial [Lentisphaeraceae bacterium]|nr:IS1595 family transposase [Lentisphaeraceae bacterium]
GIREIHECLNYFYKESLLAHTIFEHSQQPLKTWFLAIQLLTQAKTCISALELHRHLKVNIKTANLLKHKIMQMLTDAEEKRVLEGRIECDDAYLSGVHKGGKGNKGPVNKAPFLAAVQTDDSHHPQLAVLSPVEALTREEVTNWAREHIAPRSLVISDDLDCFKALGSAYCHRAYNKKVTAKRIVDTEFKWVNSVLGNMKTAFFGALHAFDFRKYCGRYLGNMQFRFNHRFNLKECFYEVLKLSVMAKPKMAKTLYSQKNG